MSIDRVFQMITRMLLRRLLNKGVNAGIRSVFGDNTPKTKDDKAMQAQARQARKLAKISRRIG
ncbi:MAG: hypothetical protein N4A70_10450 [Pelagimonas sp.]|jgi:hypothetical protein|nr:hypothetical protein [Pelagimonas sp.]